MNNDLFQSAAATDSAGQKGALERGYHPLAARLRPQSLADYAGQSHILDPGKPLRQAIDSQQLHSMILLGPAWGWQDHHCAELLLVMRKHILSNCLPY